MLGTRARRWALVVGSVLCAACGGGSADARGGTTPHAEEEPDTCTVAIRVEDAGADPAGAPSEDIAPRMALTMVRICERAGTATLALPVEVGVCTPAAPERGAIAAATCWWAGAGSVVEVMRDGDTLVARRTAHDEETPPGEPVRLGELSLPPDAETERLVP